MINLIKNKKGGFTLVEALVGISIFSIALITLMVSLGDGIADTNYAKRKTTAIYLAQEGAETMRNLRDTYMLYNAGTGWASFQTKLNNAGCMNANGCYFNDAGLNYSNPAQPITSLTMTACGSSCPTMLYDNSTGRYNYTAGSSSGFIRRIRATVVTANEIRISSTTFWPQGSGVYQMTFTDNLFNWIN